MLCNALPLLNNGQILLKGTFVNPLVKVKSLSTLMVKVRLFHAYQLIPYCSQPAKQTKLIRSSIHSIRPRLGLSDGCQQSNNSTEDDNYDDRCNKKQCRHDVLAVKSKTKFRKVIRN